MGLLQGITEFLPVSSSGHLAILQEVLRWEGPHVLFDVAVHMGTLMAILVVFRQAIKGILTGFLSEEGRKVALIIVGSVPIGISGLFLESRAEEIFSSGGVAGAMLSITGMMLWSTRYVKRGDRGPEETGVWRAVTVGVFQAAAILPGISRSGATISAALFLGLEREWAGEFSFLLAIPAIGGATLFKARDFFTLPQSALGAFGAGIIVSALSGYLALKFLLGLIRRGKFYLFAPYCWAVSAAYFLLLG